MHTLKRMSNHPTSLENNYVETEIINVFCSLQARDMSEEFDFNSNIHGRTYYHSPESLEWKEAIQCKFCGESPICGTRYKCG